MCECVGDQYVYKPAVIQWIASSQLFPHALHVYYFSIPSKCIKCLEATLFFVQKRKKCRKQTNTLFAVFSSLIFINGQTTLSFLVVLVCGGCKEFRHCLNIDWLCDWIVRSLVWPLNGTASFRLAQKTFWFDDKKAYEMR